MNLVGDLHVLRPAALLLLLGLPLCWLAWRHGRSDAGAWRGVVDEHLLSHLIERFDGTRGRAGLALAAALWTLACIALAGPAWEREPMPLYRNEAARVLVLELAPSMLAQDVKPSRLERARFKIDDILARSRDVQTALIGYGGDAFVAAPLTDDIETVKNLVDALDPSTMPVPGNATSRAIDKAVDLIEQAGLHRGEIIVIADDVDGGAASTARRARSRGFTVSVLGVGTTAGAPVALAQGDFLKDERGNVVVARLDEPALRALASAGGGRYAALAADAGDLDALIADQPDIDGGRASGEAQTDRWRDRGPWLLLVLLPLALAGFRRGWLLALVFAVLPSPRAEAASFEDLWLRADQQAAAALAGGDAKHAAEVAPDARWRGAATYRDGDYAAAETEYAQVSGAEGAYNHGNALAKLGRYEDAIAAYDAALALEPQMADAIANRKAVQDFLDRRKQQQQQNGQNGQNEKSQDQGRQQDQGGQSKDGDSQQRQEQSGQDGQSPQKNTQDGDSGDGQPSSSNSGQAQTSSPPGDAQQGERKDEGTGSPDAAAQHKPDAAQQQALSKELDQALAGKEAAQDGKQEGKAARVAEPRDDAAQEKQQALEHWLERVPDDPGGLLRRKFQLEYQRRQQGGGDGG